MTACVVGLGSNLGSRAGFLEAALDLLAATDGVRVTAVSPAYANEALGGIGPPFLNAAARLEVGLAPGALLDRMLAVEALLGRVREGHWAPRTLDLDLLWHATPVDRPPRLVVPHPALTERAFALGPLLDVAPELEGRYGAALRALGGRPPSACALAEAEGSDRWDRMAADLRRATGPDGPAPGARTAGPMGVASFVIPPPGLPARFDDAARRVSEAGPAVRRVALGPADDGGTTAYLVGPGAGPDRPE